MTKKVSRKIATKARAYLRTRALIKHGYARADQLFEEIRATGLKPGEEVVINAAGDKVVLKHLFAESDKVFRTHAISRFELELVKAS